MTQRTLAVLLVRDGRPGHEKQSLGLIASLKKRYTVRMKEVLVRPGYQALLAAISFLGGRLPRELSGFAPDLIIGTGSHTHFTMLVLQKRLGGHTVVCMSPMSPIRTRFDLCYIPRHDGVEKGENIFLTEGPPGVNTDLGTHDPTKALVLVGGVDEKSHTWDNEAISRDIVAKVVKHPHLNWKLTTSPRTPPEFLKVFSTYLPSSIFFTLVPFAESQPGWLEKQLQSTSWVLVTEDSLSMIYEALSAGCQVVTIPVSFLKENKFTRCLQDLKDRHLVVSDIEEKRENPPVILNEADRCVAHMHNQSWWSVL